MNITMREGARQERATGGPGSREGRNSGGTVLYLSPGLQYVTRRWVLEAIVQLPVIQGLNGAALEEDYIVRAGFRFAF